MNPIELCDALKKAFQKNDFAKAAKLMKALPKTTIETPEPVFVVWWFHLDGFIEAEFNYKHNLSYFSTREAAGAHAKKLLDEQAAAYAEHPWWGDVQVNGKECRVEERRRATVEVLLELVSTGKAFGHDESAVYAPTGEDLVKELKAQERRAAFRADAEKAHNNFLRTVNQK